MAQEQELKIIPMYDSQAPDGFIPAKPEVRWYHKAWAWIWNMARRPKVRAKQRELRETASRIKLGLKREVLPHLWQVRMVCPTCRDNYGFLMGEVFASSIKQILSRMACEDHPEPYRQFLAHWRADFKHSEDVAAWINGFQR